ncbi:MAG: hypothetical protein KKG11_14190, partial [Gammaproteobacteria bacterium]|nr:hypothetical protein [Gammaproteobacteria bacterium]
CATAWNAHGMLRMVRAPFCSLHHFNYTVKPKPAREKAGFRWSSSTPNLTLHALAAHLKDASLLP